MACNRGWSSPRWISASPVRRPRAATTPKSLALIERAQDETKQAIAELRELVRGIHPAVLTDRGLDAALSSLAARCPVPVTVQVNLDERPPTNGRVRRVLHRRRVVDEHRRSTATRTTLAST